nr:AAA family ATPase [Nitrospiraceae bacterium]
MPNKLAPERLYRCCGPGELDFNTTDDVKPLEGTIGQDRAMHALDFGLNFSDTGFNIYILGEAGTGKLTTIKMLLDEKAAREPVPPDWCYVYNFRDPDTPSAISLDAGKAAEFQKDMEEFVKSVKTAIPKIFESKEYEKQRSKVMEDFQKKQKDLFSQLESEAEQKGFTIKRTFAGLAMVPVKKTGEPLTEEEFEALDDKTKKKIEQIGKELQEKLDDLVRTMRQEEKAVRDALNTVEREAVLSAIGHFIEDLQNKYGKYGKIKEYLDDVREDILEHLEDFKPQQEEHAAAVPMPRPVRPEPSFVRYVVNVLVNNSGLSGAPCVFESNPTYNNLFGRIEYKFQFGAAITDFSLIKSGALHKANGGYLIVDALDLLRNVFSYEAMKRAIRNKEVKLEDIWEQYRAFTTAMLRPQPIPLNVKVILVGNPNIYYLLYSLDDEYRELFKVKADFDSFMERTPEHIRKYASFIALKCRESNLLPFDRTGVARIVE